MTGSIDNSRVWFITGASKGLGRALAEGVLDTGGRVFATARDVDAVADLPQRHPRHAAASALDVTDPDQATDAVARAEVAHLGIRVTIVEPGPVRTDFAGKSLKRADPIDDYADSVGQVRDLLAQLDGSQPNDPVRVAQTIIRATDQHEPPLHLPLGEQAFAGIRERLSQRAHELDRTQPLGIGTAFES